MKVLVPLFAVIFVGAVGFILVELRAPTTPAAPPPPVAAPTAVTQRTPPAHWRKQPVATPPSGAAAVTDPLDVVVRGKTRREWHAYYTERQLKIANDIMGYQTIIRRASAGGETDPVELSAAPTHIAELKAQLKTDLHELQQIDALP